MKHTMKKNGKTQLGQKNERQDATKKLGRRDARGKKWGDEMRDRKTSSIRTKMRPINVRMKEFS